MSINEYDIKDLHENFDDETIAKIDKNNLKRILVYLRECGIYYEKDLLINALDLFLLPLEEFIKKFELLKYKLGDNYVEKLSEDFSLINIMYED